MQIQHIVDVKENPLPRKRNRPGEVGSQYSVQASHVDSRCYKASLNPLSSVDKSFRILGCKTIEPHPTGNQQPHLLRIHQLLNRQNCFEHRDPGIQGATASPLKPAWSSFICEVTRAVSKLASNGRGGGGRARVQA